MKNAEVGSIWPTSYGHVVVINNDNRKRLQVCFIEYPYNATVSYDNLQIGVLKNPMRPKVCGVGYIGVGPYRSCVNRVYTKSYMTWRNMLQRVYRPFSNEWERQYAGTSVHPHWHNFQNFAPWYHDQIDRFGTVDFIWDLDKDLLKPGNREYGPENSCMLPKQVNVLFVDHAFARGDLPMGVMRNGTGFTPSLGSFGKNRKLGTFRTVREAQIVYWKYKIEAIQLTAMTYYKYIPERLSHRLVTFNMEDAVAYYGNDAVIVSD